MYIASYPGNKAKTHELDGIQNIIIFVHSTSKRTNHRVSAKQSHLLSVPTDKTVKWYVKQQTDDALIRKVVYWFLRNSNVC